jgi:hypothetical protein
MTFEAAYVGLTDSGYKEMRNRQNSPLHLKPLYDDTGKFRGYEHCSFMHGKNDAWIRDLTHTNNTTLLPIV